MTPRHSEQDIIPCPNCGGQGGWSDGMNEDEFEFADDNFIVCPRCQGAGTIVITIRKLPVEDER